MNDNMKGEDMDIINDHLVEVLLPKDKGGDGDGNLEGEGENEACIGVEN